MQQPKATDDRSAPASGTNRPRKKSSSATPLAIAEKGARSRGALDGGPQVAVELASPGGAGDHRARGRDGHRRDAYAEREAEAAATQPSTGSHAGIDSGFAPLRHREERADRRDSPVGEGSPAERLAVRGRRCPTAAR